MKKIYGKDVYETLAELADPKHTAVIVIDMQHVFCSNREGQQPPRDVTSARKIVEPIRNLVQAARSAGARVVYFRNTTEKNGATLSPAWLYYLSRRGRASMDVPLRDTFSNTTGEGSWEGSWAHAIIPELEPQTSDFVLNKSRPSGFTHTALDKILRANGVESVIITGVATSACVLSTARDAQFYDYYTLIAQDCIAGTRPVQDNGALAILSDRCDMVPSKDFIQLWQQQLTRD